MWRLTELLARAPGSGGVRLGAYLAWTTAVITLVAWGSLQLLALGLAAIGDARRSVSTAVRSSPPNAPTALPASQNRHILTQDEWHERIRSKDFWAGRKAGPPSDSRRDQQPQSAPRRNTVTFRDQDERPWRDRSDDDQETFRTVCVRLCDGYFWPLSFATTRENFARDQATCESSCGSPARLYVYRNPGAEIDDMASVDQEPYSRLPTAFKFRRKFDAQCRCGPQPWEREALDRHRVYALEAAQRKGDRSATKQIADLKARQEADRKRQMQQRTLAVATIRAGGIAARQPLEHGTVARPMPAAPPEPERVVTLAAHGQAFAAAKPGPAKLPVIAAAPSPLPAVAARTAGLPPGDVMIMRLGIGNAQQDITRKGNAEPKRSKAKRRDRPGT